ncbi:MAG: hypothetical protein AAFR54_16425 [Planctomycetota bacterium]
MIDELVAVAPESYPTVQAMTPDGEWVFSAEGGVLAFLHVGTTHPGNTTFPAPELRISMPDAEKRVQVGSLGVLASDLALDPDLDLSDDPPTLPAGTPPETSSLTDVDANDIVYVAGGHLGLWAIEAHPVAGYQNRAVRIDNSGNLQVATQYSKRFCTDVEVVEIEGEPFLLALFARRDRNLLRAYPLGDVRAALHAARGSTNDPPDLGHETLGVRSFYFKRHPQQGPNVIVDSENVTRAASYAMSMAVDTSPDVSDGVGDALLGDPVDVYVANLSGGLVRFRLYVDSSGGSTQVVGFRTDGPVFGTGVVPPAGVPRAYHEVASTDGGVEVNDSGLPAQWFLNHESRVTQRSAQFDELIRSDPPYFMDVAVQNELGGHYLYCAVGHLGWIRFDLAAHAFGYGMPIDHLEGRPAVPRDINGRPSGAQVFFNAKWFREIELERPTSSPFTEPFDAGNRTLANALHAWTLDLTKVGVGPEERMALVVNYSSKPWTLEPRVKGPGRVLNQNFQQLGGWDLTYPGLWHREGAARVGNVIAVFDDVAPTGGLDLPFRYDGGDVVTKNASGVDLANVTQATAVGGETLVVPYDQPDNGDPFFERIRILHTHAHAEDNGAPMVPNRVVLGNVCVSFIKVGAGTTNAVATYPAIVRDKTQMPGRYAFGAAFADAGDGNVVLQGNNDFPIFPSAPVVSLGLETGTGTLASLAAPTEPWPDPQDKRLDSGIQCDERCQFVLDGPSGTQEQWVIGDRTVPNISGTPYYFAKHSVEPQPSGIPTIKLLSQWLLGRHNNMWGTDEHGYYRSMTSHPALDAFTLGVMSGPGIGPDPDGFDPLGTTANTFLTGTAMGSPDGVLVIGRNTILEYLPTQTAGEPAMGLGFIAPFRDGPWEREAAAGVDLPSDQPRSLDWAFTLNSHPEWNGVHYPRRTSPVAGSSLARSQQLFWAEPSPLLTDSEPDFAGRIRARLIQPITEAATTFTFLPKVTSLGLDPAGAADGLVLGAPCGYASCPPDLSVILGTKLAVDPNDPWPIDSSTGSVIAGSWGASYHFLPIPAAYNAAPPWDAQYRRGFVSLWQISGDPAFPTTDAAGNDHGVDPWSRARRATDPTSANAWHPTERPAGSPDLDPLFLEGVGSCAFQLQFLDLVDGDGNDRSFALVADFAGSVQVFDITDLLQSSIGPRTPFSVWTAPPDPLELRRPNVFDVAADRLDDPTRANVYIACSRMGVHVITFDADDGFVLQAEHMVMPGSAHSVSIREIGSERLLLVDDLSAGYRFYRRP